MNFAMIQKNIRNVKLSTLWLWFVIGIVALLIGGFIELTEETLYEEQGSGESEIQAFDQVILEGFAGIRTERLTRIVVDITAMGSVTVLSMMCVIFLLLAWMKRDRVGIFHLSVGAIGATVLVEVLKNYFSRARPDIVPSLVSLQSYSYPSGHSLGSAAIYFTLAVIACRHFKSTIQRTVIFVLSSLIVIAIGLSRVYLGVHFPSDVIAGISLGAAWAFLLAVGIMVFKKGEMKEYEGEPAPNP